MCLFSAFSYARPKGEKTRSLLFFLFFFSLLVLLRLAYLKNILVPPYFDSVTHVRIANAFLQSLKNLAFPSFTGLTDGYYHLGYHLLISLLAWGFHANLFNVILIFGQLTLAALPLFVFLLINELTHEKSAAFLSALIAAFAWKMPILAVDWGKYPALLSLFSFTLFLLLTSRMLQKKTTFWSLAGLTLLAVLTVFIHSRTLFLIILLATGIFFTKATSVLSPAKKRSLLRIQGGAIAIAALIIAQDSLLSLALEPYFTFPSLVIFFMLPLVYRDFPEESQILLFLLLGLLAGLYIPFSIQSLNFSPNLTLFDRPFTEIFLHLPLALLGGLGFASLEKRVRSFAASQVASLAVVSLTIFFSFYLLTNAVFYSSGCCNLVTVDDVFTLDWIDENLPAEAQILVAGNYLTVMSTDAEAANLVGSDAGIWIPYFAHRKILPHPYTADFSSPQTKEFLCSKEANYIYVGHTPESFSRNELDSERNYHSIVSIGSSALYEVTGCP